MHMHSRKPKTQKSSMFGVQAWAGSPIHSSFQVFLHRTIWPFRIHVWTQTCVCVCVYTYKYICCHLQQPPDFYCVRFHLYLVSSIKNVWASRQTAQQKGDYGWRMLTHNDHIYINIKQAKRVNIMISQNSSVEEIQSDLTTGWRGATIRHFIMSRNIQMQIPQCLLS